MLMRWTVLMLLAAALTLSACGKKPDRLEREGESAYPRTYPTSG